MKDRSSGHRELLTAVRALPDTTLGQASTGSQACHSIGRGEVVVTCRNDATVRTDDLTIGPAQALHVLIGREIARNQTGHVDNRDFLHT